MPNRPRRSALYMPGSNTRALEKARTLPADAVIFDLEDSVAPEAKAAAREQVAAVVRAGGYGRREVVVRINEVGSGWWKDDLAVIAAAGPDAILVPKIDTALDIKVLDERLKSTGAPAHMQLWVMMETPLAVLNARAIAEASSEHPDSRLACFVLGANDIVKETRAQHTPDRTALLFALSQCVFAARAYGLDILDSVYNDFRDTEGFRRECLHGRMLGMDGKTLIHPGQVEIANAVFAPPADEIAWARKVLAAFELPENRGKAAINLDGKMVELLHAEIARRTVAVADAIEQLKV